MRLVYNTGIIVHAGIQCLVDHDTMKSAWDFPTWVSSCAATLPVIKICCRKFDNCRIWKITHEVEAITVRLEKHTHPVSPGICWVHLYVRLWVHAQVTATRKCLQSIKGRRRKEPRGAEGRRGGDRAAVVGLYWKQVAEQVELASSRTWLVTLCAGHWGHACARAWRNTHRFNHTRAETVPAQDDSSPLWWIISIGLQLSYDLLRKLLHHCKILWLLF